MERRAIVTEVTDESAVQVHLVQPRQAVALSGGREEYSYCRFPRRLPRGPYTTDWVDPCSLTNMSAVRAISERPEVPKLVPFLAACVLSGFPKDFL
jgi:hypothetical protein